MEKEFTCIICPVGCRLYVDKSGDISGHKCKRGIAYAEEEITNPTRMLTTTVKVKSRLTKRLSVRTSRPIPKGALFDVMKALEGIEAEVPVKVHDVIVENVAGTKADILATRSLDE